MSETVQEKKRQPLSKKQHARLKKLRSVRNARDGYLFLLPWFIGLMAFVVAPFLFSLFLSFQKVGIRPDGSGFQYTFIGWDNFKYAFLKDNLFPVALFNFFREALLVVPITVIFAFVISIFLNLKFPGRGIFRTIFFLPVIFASGKTLLELFSEGQGKVPLLEQYNINEIIYSALPESTATPIIAILGKFVLILWFSGVQIVIFMAAFQTVSASTYEAARIDGATPWETFWKITFPAVVPFIMLNLIYTTIELSANPFNPILKMFTDNVTNPKTGYGYVSAIGWIYSMLIFILIAIFASLARTLYSKKKGAGI